MDFAVAQKIIVENPCKAVALPKVEHREMHTIPADQLQAFLTEAKATGVYEMYYIELATGLRRGELLGLKWEDIDLAAGIIRVHRQVARINGEIVEAPLKTKNSYRVVSISPQAIEVLKSQRAKTNDEYVFPSPNGGPISPDSVNNMLSVCWKGLEFRRFGSMTSATPSPPSLCKTAWTSKLCPVCWATSPRASPWTLTPMSLPPRRRRQRRLWGTC